MMNAMKGVKESKFLDFISKWGTLIVLLVTVLLFSFSMSDTFFTFDNMVTILRAMSIVTVAAIGVTFSVIVNGFDMSVGSTMTFANAVCMSMFIWYTANTPMSLLVGLIAALLIGLFNVILIVYCKVPDMLATLASLFVFEGIATTYAEGGAITAGMSRLNGTATTGVVQQSFKMIGAYPYIILIMLVIVILAFVFTTFTKHGRYMYIVGGNIEAARLSGINVKKYRSLAYLISAGCAGIAGMMLASRLGYSPIGSGSQYLMPAIAAVFIGFSVAGAGKANIFGTFIGAALIAVLENGLVMASFPYYSLNIIKGGVLVLALILTYLRSKD